MTGMRQTIDWQEVYRRLDAARTSVMQGLDPAPEDRRRILRERARALAKDDKRGMAEGKMLEVVEFMLAHERYGIETAYVREVYPLREFTPVPCTPPFVIGIVNVRGQILSVIDIKKFFDMPDRGLTDLNKVIILSSGNVEVGILADSVSGVRTVPVNDLQISVLTFTGLREEYLRGITPERMVILDAPKLLEDRNIIVHEEVGS